MPVERPQFKTNDLVDFGDLGLQVKTDLSATAKEFVPRRSSSDWSSTSVTGQDLSMDQPKLQRAHSQPMVDNGNHGYNWGQHGIPNGFSGGMPSNPDLGAAHMVDMQLQSLLSMQIPTGPVSVSDLQALTAQITNLVSPCAALATPFAFPVCPPNTPMVGQQSFSNWGPSLDESLCAAALQESAQFEQDLKRSHKVRSLSVDISNLCLPSNKVSKRVSPSKRQKSQAKASHGTSSQQPGPHRLRPAAPWRHSRSLSLHSIAEVLPAPEEEEEADVVSSSASSSYVSSSEEHDQDECTPELTPVTSPTLAPSLLDLARSAQEKPFEEWKSQWGTELKSLMSST